MEYVHVALAEALCLALHMHGLRVFLEADAGPVLKGVNFWTQLFLRMAMTNYTIKWMRARTPFVWDRWKFFRTWCFLMVYLTVYDTARLFDPRVCGFMFFGLRIIAGPSHPDVILAGAAFHLFTGLALGRALMEVLAWTLQCIDQYEERTQVDEDKGYDELA